ncbi:protein of unknown function [Candidatus Nitrosocosmicus franklandus]|uniref:Uncharacterized protein n=1 Tax=Candidatus Nitrosocosmicus franklandianus TaxID=1798806 RepID=A0A484I8L2_9ARCH|nr:protein of unknown function [Candidatus Nitrosocosmicus franklandus]
MEFACNNYSEELATSTTKYDLPIIKYLFDIIAASKQVL